VIERKGCEGGWITTTFMNSSKKYTQCSREQRKDMFLNLDVSKSYVWMSKDQEKIDCGNSIEGMKTVKAYTLHRSEYGTEDR
jgi:hypothetical protein